MRGWVVTMSDIFILILEGTRSRADQDRDASFGELVKEMRGTVPEIARRTGERLDLHFLK